MTTVKPLTPSMIKSEIRRWSKMLFKSVKPANDYIADVNTHTEYGGWTEFKTLTDWVIDFRTTYNFEETAWSRQQRNPFAVWKMTCKNWSDVRRWVSNISREYPRNEIILNNRTISVMSVRTA